LSPDVLVAMTTPATAALQAATHTIPIVFAAIADPVGGGFAASLAQPGGNITGFVDIEGSLGGKWLELIHEIAPSASRVAFLFNPQTAPFARYYLDTFRSSAAALNIAPIESAVHTAAEVEAAMAKLGREGGGESLSCQKPLREDIIGHQAAGGDKNAKRRGLITLICFATRRPMWTV
jgi:putative tryptophan/tyrosine transport system substrate-binding protein